jgi:hypothetical protein
MESQPRKMPILIAKKEDLLSINLDVHPAWKCFSAACTQSMRYWGGQSTFLCSKLV